MYLCTRKCVVKHNRPLVNSLFGQRRDMLTGGDSCEKQCDSYIKIKSKTDL